MTTVNIIEIVGALISLGLAGASLYKAHSNIEDANRAFVIACGGMILTYMLSLRYDFIPDIFHANEIMQDPQSVELGKEYTPAHQTVDNANNPLFYEAFYSERRHYVHLLELAAKGQFLVEKDEIEDYAPKIFDKAPDHSAIYATSYVRRDDWWSTTWGQNYLQKNYDAINKRGCTIERIYIFPDSAEFLRTEAEMKVQKKNRIRIYYAFTSQITSSKPYELTEDMVIVGNTLGGNLFLTREREAINILFSTHQADLDDLKKKYDKLKDYAKQY